MSNLTPSPDALQCEADAASTPSLTGYPARSTDLGGGLVVRRALPQGGRRLVGPWCFLDHFGPLAFDAGKPMDVAPHPHIGLQTVTWLIEGEVLHKDSLGYEQMIRPSQLNLMTAGGGISHSEETPPRHSRALHGLQLWLALPDAHRHAAPAFDHYSELPVVALGTGRATVVIGELDGVRSPVHTYSSTIGAELAIDRDGRIEVCLAPSFEHAILLIHGHAGLGDTVLAPDTLYYLGTGREQLSLRLRAGARLMLLGGEPFRERILMWWNFVARTPEEIAEARRDWEQAHRRFGAVSAYVGDRLPAPPLTPRLRRPR
jgi:redox-sensitive bicupin YhaK (pirin superfamily)